MWINAAIFSAIPLAFAVAAQSFGRFPFEWQSLRWTGLALVVGGAALRWLAVLTLGSRFTVDLAIAANHELVRRGPYRILRHPSYSGALLSFVGLGVALGNFACVAVLLLPVGFAFLNRMRVEEEMMCAAFPQDYPAYRRATWALAPFIY